jgi:DNA-binding NarL/FixJ family response regulator/class 3 adenylate cyclase
MSERPIGTVTFLFTDIEGSTQLLKQLRERYGSVLADHQRLLRAAFAAHGGEEIDTQGDAFFYVFSRARDAAAAAAEAQRTLAANTWPDGTDLRVRMGMHTGEPHLSDEGRYHGMGVHRTARITAAGHGGQVLASQATASVLADDELDGITLRDLGEHSLKDLDRPERIYQLEIAGLERTFAPLTTDAPATAADELAAPPTPIYRPGGAPSSAAPAIRVVLGEDTYLVREGIKLLLEPETDIELVAGCPDLPSLLHSIDAEQPDVVLTDIRMPPTNRDEGIQVANRLRETRPETGVVVLSQFAAPKYALALLEQGAERRAYLLKDRVGDAAQLTAAIREVARGGSVIDPKIVEALLAARARDDSPLDELTPRERQTLEEMAQGKSNAAIAESLVITEGSVEKITHSIFQKLGLTWQTEINRRVKAVLLYLAERG